MGALLQRLLHFVSPDDHHQHVYATLGCCSNIRIEDHDDEITPVPSKEDDPGDLGRQQAAHVGHRQ